jgi:hypothetical protein
MVSQRTKKKWSSTKTKWILLSCSSSMSKTTSKTCL